MSDSDEANFIQRAQNGDAGALGQLLETHRDRLVRMIRFRMDRRLLGRIEPDDVVQETYVVVTSRIHDYTGDNAAVPFFVWLRFLTLQKLAELHRRHLNVKARDAGRDVPLRNSPLSQTSSAVMAAELAANQTSPSQAAVRAELQTRLHKALEEMEPMDREVIALRNFEQLSNTECASVLNIAASAASNRYIRALKRLKVIIEAEQPF